MKLPILLFAEDAKPIDPALAYQTARADAAEAALAVANSALQMKQIEIEWYKAQLNIAPLQAKADVAAKALEAAKPKETKETK